MQYVEIILDSSQKPRRGKAPPCPNQNPPNKNQTQPIIKNAGYAPYLDYRPLQENEQTVVESFLAETSLPTDIESLATGYAIANIVPQHIQQVKQYKQELIDKTLTAVKDRLTKEINYWDYRAAELKQQKQAGKSNAKINSAKARARTDEL